MSTDIDDRLHVYFELARQALEHRDYRAIGVLAEHILDTLDSHDVYERTARSSNRVDLDAMKEQIMSILTDAGKPMAVKDIVAEMKSRGYPIPGKGEPANVITHLRRWEEFSRPKYGWYGLAEWDKTPAAS